MADFDLQFQVPETMTDDLARTSFFWTSSGSSSFRTSLGPDLRSLGPVQPANIDLVRIAVMVYAADRSVSRKVGRVNWTPRTIKLRVPVLDAAAWNAVKAELEEMLGFLSGDTWTISFRHDSLQREDPVANPFPDVERVGLLSGGADSAAGALLARSQDREHLLISHVGATSISPVQKDVAKRIRELLPEGSAQHHKQVLLTRMQRQPGGLKLRNETSTRTRSFLFLALGLAMASLNRVPLWIPENGFASLNPPLGPDQLGSLSTRTTHPWFLAKLSQLANEAGAHADILNPFATKTKGEMFRWVADVLGNDEASGFLSATNSCAHTNRRFVGVSAKRHCGVCFGCLLRRASFSAAGLADTSVYVIDAPPNAAVAANLRKLSVLSSVEGFVTRGLTIGDIAAIRLPEGYRASEARSICKRGRAELEFLL